MEAQLPLVSGLGTKRSIHCRVGLRDGKVSLVFADTTHQDSHNADDISLVVVTRCAPSSMESQKLAANLQGLRKLSSVRTKVSMHILYLAPEAPENPNAFLNLARAFARSPVVVLFPGSLSVAPPKTFFRSVASAAHLPRAAVFSTRQHASFPFAPLSPVVLGREDPLWCTERFFPPLSRSFDWTECLWQVWLEKFGDIEVKLTTDWIHEPRQIHNASVGEVRMLPFDRCK